MPDCRAALPRRVNRPSLNLRKHDRRGEKLLAGKAGEPTAYSWDDFVRDGRTSWTGVRNFKARNNLRAMKVNDEVFYYHSVVGKEVIGIARVVRAAYPDCSAKDGDWSTVDLSPVRKLKKTVSLDQIKETPALKDISLVRQSRLSVHALSATQFHAIKALAS